MLIILFLQFHAIASLLLPCLRLLLFLLLLLFVLVLLNHLVFLLHGLDGKIGAL